MVLGTFLYPTIAVAGTLAASAYIWYEKPGIPIKWLLRYAVYNAGLKIKRVQGSKYNYCYAERGKKRPNTPSLLFIHGFSASKDMWVPVIKKLPSNAHIVLVDLPGHGDTTPMPVGEGEDISLKHMVNAVHDFVHAVGLAEPFHLIGTSMGGGVAAIYASLYAEDVGQLTIACPALLRKPPVTTDFMKAIEVGEGSDYLVPTDVDEMSAMFNHILYCKEKLPKNKQVLKGMLQIRTPKTPFHKKLFKALSNERHKGDQEINDILANIRVPTQIIWGKEDELMHYASAEVLQKMIPGCERVDLLDQCGHTISWDRPGLLVKHLLEFRGDLTSSSKSD